MLVLLGRRRTYGCGGFLKEMPFVKKYPVFRMLAEIGVLRKLTPQDRELHDEDIKAMRDSSLGMSTKAKQESMIKNLLGICFTHNRIFSFHLFCHLTFSSYLCRRNWYSALPHRARCAYCVGFKRESGEKPEQSRCCKRPSSLFAGRAGKPRGH